MALCIFYFSMPRRVDEAIVRAALRREVGWWNAHAVDIFCADAPPAPGGDGGTLTLGSTDIIVLVYAAKVALALGGTSLPELADSRWRLPSWAATPWVEKPWLDRLRIWVGPTAANGEFEDTQA